jgi:hypothetical protein
MFRRCVQNQDTLLICNALKTRNHHGANGAMKTYSLAFFTATKPVMPSKHRKESSSSGFEAREGILPITSSIVMHGVVFCTTGVGNGVRCAACGEGVG